MLEITTSDLLMLMRKAQAFDTGRHGQQAFSSIQQMIDIVEDAIDNNLPIIIRSTSETQATA